MDQEALKQIRRILIMAIGIIESEKIRRVLILAVGLIEDDLGIDRTIPSHNERREAKRK